MQYKLLFPEAARLLREVGFYLRERAQYTQAEPLLQQSLAIYEQVSGLEHPNVASSLNSLALLYHSQGRYSEAEPLYRRSLAIRERVLGSEYPETAYSLNNLAELYREQGRYSEAEPLYQRVLAIYEKFNLSLIVASKADEPLYQRTLAIYGKMPDHDDPDIVTVLENYIALLRESNRTEEAAKFEERAKEIRTKLLH